MSQLLGYSLIPCTKSDTDSTATNAPNLGGGILGADGFLVTGTGNVAFIPDTDAAAVVLTAVAANVVIPLRVKRINSTLTTATGLYYAYQRLP